MREVLSLIVASTTPKERTSLNARLKGRRMAQRKRLRRLHVIMAVNQEMGTVPRPFSKGPRDHDGIALGRAKVRVQPNGLTVLLDPARARCQIRFMLWLGRDTRKTDI